MKSKKRAGVGSGKLRVARKKTLLKRGDHITDLLPVIPYLANSETNIF